MLDGTMLVANAGEVGLVTGNVISGNGAHASAAAVPHGGVVVNNAELGGYTLTGNEVFGNTGGRFMAPSIAKIGARTVIESNRIHNNIGDGIGIAAASTNLSIRDNAIWSNSGTDLALTGAVVATGLTLRGNDLRGATVNIAQTLVESVISSNAGYGAPTGVVLVGASGGINAT